VRAVRHLVGDGAVALVTRVRDAHQRAEVAWSRVAVGAGAGLDIHERRLDDRARQVTRRTEGAVAVADERLRARAAALANMARRRLDAEAGRATLRAHRAAQVGPGVLRRAEAVLDLAAARVGALDPAVAMARGWSITYGPDGRAVRSVADAPAGATLRTLVGDGTIVSEVTHTGP
jgi:exodeoxyribonuclease VII large subunit